MKIKKVVLLIMCILFLGGCNFNKSDNLKSFINYNTNKDSYQLKGTMSIISNEDEFTYDVEASVYNLKYYKIDLINNINDHEQVILKNDDGVYVVTPALNKSYKFASNWPMNSSQIYLLERLVDDVSKDSNATIKKTDNGYEIMASVNYPNNQKLSKEKIYVDDKFNVKEVYVYDKDDNTCLSIKISNIDYNPKFSNDYFNLDSLVKEDTKEEKKEECTSENCEKEKTTSNILEEIIYPLYVPTDTYLKSKDTVDSDEGSRHILTFAGVDPFILVEEVSSVNDEMEIIPVNGEPLQLGATIGALQDNSLSWTVNGIDYYLTSSTLDNNEMMTIAESITNSTSLVAKTK